MAVDGDATGTSPYSILSVEDLRRRLEIKTHPRQVAVLLSIAVADVVFALDSIPGNVTRPRHKILMPAREHPTLMLSPEP